MRGKGLQTKENTEKKNKKWPVHITFMQKIAKIFIISKNKLWIWLATQYLCISFGWKKNNNCTNMITTIKCKWWYLLFWKMKQFGGGGGLISNSISITYFILRERFINEFKWKMTHSNEICTLAPVQINSIYKMSLFLLCNCMDSMNLQFKYRIHSERTNGRILWSFIVFNSVWYTFGTMKMISCIKLITNRIRASGWQQFAMTFHQNKTNIIGLCSVFFRCRLIIKDSWILNKA